MIERDERALLDEWLNLLRSATDGGREVGDVQLRESARGFLAALRQGLSFGNSSDLSRSEWNSMRDLLKDLSRQRAEHGFTPSETAIFVFSFKQLLFARLYKEIGNDSDGFADEIWRATNLLDRLGLETMEVFQKTREEIIRRQQQELLELSTPVVRLWDNILALPLIGTLDSARTQIVMQNLLEAVVSHSAAIAIIDITGVPTVDTLVAQHLLKTVAAARLMGADCIISGIRPQIAQTIIHLGVDLSDVVTKATLADAFQLALRKLGYGLATATGRSEKA
ncbi:MAG TPA: STAS domain-containing protein [Bryobacteraceae bacterium]|nr:STAS domain-containing protein [Bryobacteraceae bacterium]